MVEVSKFDPAMHTGKVSKAGRCAQGGVDTCEAEPVFSVVAEHYNVATCDKHLAGAVRQALGMARRPAGPR